MTAVEVRSLIPTKAEQFVKVPGAVPTDAFDEVGIHVLYRKDGRCEAVELATPSVPVLRGTPLLGVPFCAVERFVKTLDNHAEIDGSGLTSYALGLAVYCPGHDENPNQDVESIFAFERGYYDAP